MIRLACIAGTIIKFSSQEQICYETVGKPLVIQGARRNIKLMDRRAV